MRGRRWTFSLPALLLVCAVQAAAQDWYVTTNGTGLGTSWDDPTNSIQGAIDASSPSSGSPVTIWVSNGVYDAGGVVYPEPGALTNRVAVRKQYITLRAASTNPADTVIVGAWDPLTTNGPAAIRCVIMVDNCKSIGFTLTNGATRESTAAQNYQKRGGGLLAIRQSDYSVYKTTYNMASNCVMIGNAAGQHGGGTHFGGGTMYDCSFIDNRAGSEGGGARVGSYYNCDFIGNTAPSGAGGASSTHYDCTFTDNIGVGLRSGTAYNSHIEKSTGRGAASSTLYDSRLIGNLGGGADTCTLYDCMVISNTATDGGGMWQGEAFRTTFIGNKATGGGGGYATWDGTFTRYMWNCLFMGNEAARGGAVRGGTLHNCTVVGNKATISGGGVYAVNIYNSIIYSNDAPSDVNWNSTGTACAFTNSCTFPAQDGWAEGNITDYPKFMADGLGYGTNHFAGDYRLQKKSPCVDAGLNMDWMTNSVTGLDIDGNPRILDGAWPPVPENAVVDMGAYEFITYPPPGSIFTSW